MQTKYTDFQKERARLLRESYIHAGINEAKKNEILHIKACMLYWAEGSKQRNMFQFTNCDVNTHKIMILFLKKYFPTQITKLKARINYYSSQSLSYDDIKNYWKHELDLTDDQFIKPTDRAKYYKLPSTNKYPYGILQIQLNSTELVHNVFGSINQYIGTNIYSA